MNASVKTCNFDTQEVPILGVESAFAKGFGGIQIIGNPSEICKEGKERAKAALEALGIQFPQKRILVSLTPGDVRKDGSHLDLPLAVSLALLVRGVAPHSDLRNWLFAAEVGIGGELRPIKGAIPMAIAAIQENLAGMVLCHENLNEVLTLKQFDFSHLNRMPILGFNHLSEIIQWLDSGKIVQQNNSPDKTRIKRSFTPDFDDMILTPEQRRLAICIAAGFHNTILRGTPGSGKSMLAHRLQSILPSMGKKEHLEALKIYSCNMMHLPPNLLRGDPPFRSPHHQSSAAAVLGTPERPGELSLAHGGILFLDEMPEFRRDLLESLREPLETYEVQVSRAKKKVTWQARVLMIAACNNCPCGWLGSSKRLCSCLHRKAANYLQRLSGPILDRFDIQFQGADSPNLNSQLLAQLATTKMEQTESMRLQVAKVIKFSHNRNSQFGFQFNRDINAKNLIEILGISSSTLSSWLQSISPNFSPRAVLKSLRVARTLADIDISSNVEQSHLLEAFSFQSDPNSLLGLG